MPTLRGLLVPITFLALLSTVVHLTHSPLHSGREPGSQNELLVLPEGSSATRFGLGQQTTLADFYWLQLVQYVGTPTVIKKGFPQLLELVDLITDLDPEHGYAYEVGGILLSTAGRIEESNRILEKGMEHVPHRWQLPFYAGYNQWFEAEELSRGAELVLRAARIPGSPAYLTGLATQLFSSADQLEAAILLLQAALEQNPSEAIKEEMLARHADLLIERDLRYLEEAIARYEARFGHPPSSLLLLVGPIINGLPTAPDGSAYVYDEESASVSSPLLPRRLEYYRTDLPPTPRATEP